MDANTIVSGCIDADIIRNISIDRAVSSDCYWSITQPNITVDLDFYDYKVSDNMLILTKKEIAD